MIKTKIKEKFNLFLASITKSKLFILLAAIFCSTLLISNILASKTFVLGKVILPCAVTIFPIVYIVNDVLAEIYGFKKATAIIWIGFAMNLLAVIFYMIAIALPGSDAGTSEAFGKVLGSTPRILLGSFTAYLVGSILNALVLTKMRDRTNGRYLMLRCIVSTVVGESLDALIFITIAFAGTMPTSVLFTMMGVQAAFKIAYEIVIYPLTRLTIEAINKLED